LCRRNSFLDSSPKEGPDNNLGVEIKDPIGDCSWYKLLAYKQSSYNA